MILLISSPLLSLFWVTNDHVMQVGGAHNMIHIATGNQKPITAKVHVAKAPQHNTVLVSKAASAAAQDQTLAYHTIGTLTQTKKMVVYHAIKANRQQPRKKIFYTQHQGMSTGILI